MKKGVQIAKGILAIIVILGVCSCAVNPVTGKQELMLLSESEEIKLGGQTDAQVVSEYGIYKDEKLTAHLAEICRRVGKTSHRPNLSYHFKILDASVVNAFAVPGGYVYFTRGILASLNSEAELAGVMGHEVGHITARHSAQQYSRAQLAQIGLMGLALGLPEELSSLAGVAQFGVGMLFLRFSRDNERQADDLGVEYSAKVGYDPSQMANFFLTLERMNPSSDRTGLPEWFSTHPNPENRVAAVRARAKEWQAKLGLKDTVVNQEAYLRQIDGLVFGDDPRQGYVEGGIFYHPELRLQFPVPKNWNLNNTQSNVQIISEGKDAVILFTLAKGTSPGEAAKAFATQNKAQVIKSEPLQVNGLPAERLVSNVQAKTGMTRVMSCFIQRGKEIFVFHGLASQSLFQKYEAVFHQTMQQFKELSDPRKMDVKPERVRIRTTRSADTLENSLRSFGIPEKRLKEMTLLNGRSLNDVVPAQTLIKVVEK